MIAIAVLSLWCLLFYAANRYWPFSQNLFIALRPSQISLCSGVLLSLVALLLVYQSELGLFVSFFLLLFAVGLCLPLVVLLINHPGAVGTLLCFVLVASLGGWL